MQSLVCRGVCWAALVASKVSAELGPCLEAGDVCAPSLQNPHVATAATEGAGNLFVVYLHINKWV